MHSFKEQTRLLCCALPSGNDRRFKRYPYFSVDTTIDLIILHYVGNESIVIDFPHGNSHHCQPYNRTCPSEKLKNSVDCPGNVYKKAVASSNSPVNYESTIKSKQIANLQQNEHSKSRLTHDALYNLHELAFDLRPFVISIKTFLDVFIVCGHGSLAEELDGLLQAESEVLNFFRTTPHSSWVIFICLCFSFGTQPSSPHQLSPVSFSSMNVNFNLVMKSLCVRLLKKFQVW